jgi:hypothetical protein
MQTIKRSYQDSNGAHRPVIGALRATCVRIFKSKSVFESEKSRQTLISSATATSKRADWQKKYTRDSRCDQMICIKKVLPLAPDELQAYSKIFVCSEASWESEAGTAHRGFCQQAAP